MNESPSCRRAEAILSAGTSAPDFALRASPFRVVRLKELRGRPVVQNALESIVVPARSGRHPERAQRLVATAGEPRP